MKRKDARFPASTSAAAIASGNGDGIQRAQRVVALSPIDHPLAREGESLSDDDPVLTARIATEMPWLRRYACSLVYNRADADDLVQDCLTTALRKKAALQHPDRLRGWLLSILTNVFRARVRSRARAIFMPIDDFADSIVASVPPADRSAARDLVRAMGALSAEHRQILLLIHMEGHSYHEAADTLGIPIGTVMSRLARARRRLRALLEGQDDAAT
jgi:RNA polymerase sigma-70 factor (ECF subfamily)